MKPVKNLKIKMEVMKIKKIALILSILLIISVTVGATELGLEQYWNGNTKLRLDANYANFAIPLESSIDSFEAGLKIPTTLSDSYLITKLRFKEYTNWKFEEFKAGAGYPLKLGNWTIRGEFVAVSPEWSNVAEWKFQPSLTFGFNFSLLKTE